MSGLRNALRSLYQIGREGEFINVNNIKLIFTLKIINISFYNIKTKKKKTKKFKIQMSLS